jgi:hypothetical protein
MTILLMVVGFIIGIALVISVAKDWRGTQSWRHKVN